MKLMANTAVTGATISGTGTIETGMIVPYAANSVPTGYLACDGSAVSRSTYSALFAVISTTWGTGDGSTTFNVPNLNRRTLVGSGGSSTSTLGSTVGSTGGEEDHTLTISEMPSHDHTGAGCRILTTGAGTAANLTLGGGAYNYINNITPQGGGGAHNTIQPSAVIKYLIKT